MDYDYENERAWYVIQSYSGCENAAKVNLERRIKSMNMENYIFQVLIPEEKRYEKKKNGELKEIVERIYPGYLFVDMIVTVDSWWVVRNTPRVSGVIVLESQIIRSPFIREIVTICMGASNHATLNNIPSSSLLPVKQSSRGDKMS